MLKSKLRKTGVYLHLRTRSLENACYSSTTCPTLSTLFLQNVPDCPPEALSFLPRFARFYSIYYIQAVAKTHFLQVKIFILPTEKHRVLRSAGGQKQPQISAQIGSSAAIFPRGFGPLQAAVHARICRRFRALRTLVSERFGRLFPDVFCVVFFLIIYRTDFTPNGRFRKCRCALRRQRKNRCFRTVQNAARQGSASAPSAKRESYVSETPQTPWFCLSCAGFVFGYKM